MGENTAIEWTNSTWNPWVGCRKVSSGCKNCYMFQGQRRYGRDPSVVRRTGDSTFRAPLRWKDPEQVFACSWSDFFIEEADPWRDEAWDIIRRTPHLTYQILTKRPERIVECLPKDWGGGWPNVWLGVTAENQQAAEERIPYLLDIPAKVHFLSCEPLLGRIDLMVDFAWLIDGDIDWVIVGGESGPGCRPMDKGWAMGIISDCIVNGIPVFLKQLGGYPDKRGGDKAVLYGERWHQFPVSWQEKSTVK